MDGFDCLILVSELDCVMVRTSEQGDVRMARWIGQDAVPIVLRPHQHVISVEAAYTAERIVHSLGLFSLSAAG